MICPVVVMLVGLLISVYEADQSHVETTPNLDQIAGIVSSCMNIPEDTGNIISEELGDLMGVEASNTYCMETRLMQLCTLIFTPTKPYHSLTRMTMKLIPKTSKNACLDEQKETVITVVQYFGPKLSSRDIDQNSTGIVGAQAEQTSDTGLGNLPIEGSTDQGDTDVAGPSEPDSESGKLATKQLDPYESLVEEEGPRKARAGLRMVQTPAYEAGRPLVSVLHQTKVAGQARQTVTS